MPPHLAGLTSLSYAFACENSKAVLHGFLMPRSSTSYRPKWNLGKTTVIRVPRKLAPALLRYARELDEKFGLPDLHHPAPAGRTPEAAATTKPRNVASDSSLSTSCPNPRQTPARPRPTKLRCDIRATFATAFKNWRLKKNIPLKQLAADLGVALATISAWELGKRFPTDHHFELLMDYTGVPPCRLFCVMADKCVPVECLLAMPQKP
jgi:DNA-binding transcriptional regulator YiaG